MFGDIARFLLNTVFTLFGAALLLRKLRQVTIAGHPHHLKALGLDGLRQRADASARGGIAGEVVGKDIDDLSVSRVAGSSLTSGGFNDSLETIKADARA